MTLRSGGAFDLHTLAPVEDGFLLLERASSAPKINIWRYDWEGNVVGQASVPIGGRTLSIHSVLLSPGDSTIAWEDRLPYGVPDGAGGRVNWGVVGFADARTGELLFRVRRASLCGRPHQSPLQWLSDGSAIVVSTNAGYGLVSAADGALELLPWAPAGNVPLPAPDGRAVRTRRRDRGWARQRASVGERRPALDCVRVGPFQRRVDACLAALRWTRPRGLRDVAHEPRTTGRASPIRQRSAPAGQPADHWAPRARLAITRVEHHRPCRRRERGHARRSGPRGSSIRKVGARTLQRGTSLLNNPRPHPAIRRALVAARPHRGRPRGLGSERLPRLGGERLGRRATSSTGRSEALPQGWRTLGAEAGDGARELLDDVVDVGLAEVRPEGHPHRADRQLQRHAHRQ